MDTGPLIRRFGNDEEVRYDFEEAGYIAKTKDRETPYPMVLIAADKHPTVDQVIMSALHEVAHLRGMHAERKAEDWALRQYVASGGHPWMLGD